MTTRLSRRRFFVGAGTIASAAIVGRAQPAEAQAREITVGFIYVGPRDDFGWNQAHAVGAQALRAARNVKLVEQENVPETIAVQNAMESMINLDGASLIFPTSFGYFDPHMLVVARRNTRVEFRHAAGLWSAERHPANTGSYFAYIDQGHYINGVAAGLSTRSNKLGFVGAKPIAPVLRNINSFLLGAKSVNTNAVVQLIFTGDWSLPVREAEATNSLVDQSCDVITCHVDSPKVVVETAERRGAKVCGHNADQARLAPRGFITGAEYNWGKVYTDFAGLLARGERIPNFVRGGFEADFVRSTTYGAGATEQARTAAEAAKAQLRAGNFAIFRGPLKDNRGNEVIPSGRSYAQADPWLEQMSFLVEGVNGSLT